MVSHLSLAAILSPVYLAESLTLSKDLDGVNACEIFSPLKRTSNNISYHFKVSHLVFVGSTNLDSYCTALHLLRSRVNRWNES